ncbi:hypothetical protein ENBRE01_0484 [Enteropsectra breve]|nr:hypothetical protein ENBRE01_0484 [Enteropsectra breve]
MNDIGSVLRNNNSVLIEKLTDNYLASKIDGNLTPALITHYIENKEFWMAEKIILMQLSRLDEFGSFRRMHNYSSMDVIKAAYSLNITLYHGHFERILYSAYLMPWELNDEEVFYVSTLLARYMEGLSANVCDEVENIFVKYYSTNLGKIYARCMPQSYFMKKSNALDFTTKRERYYECIGVANGADRAYAEWQELIILREAFLGLRKENENPPGN